MRPVFLALALTMVSSFANAEGIPQDVLNVVPDKYECVRLKDPHRDPKERFSISRVKDFYVLEFMKDVVPFMGAHAGEVQQRPKPGSLAQYLLPLGVDKRIIAYYDDWEIYPIKIPAKSCTAKTFGSKYAEELDCKVQGITVKIAATGSRGKDIYTIKDADLTFSTKVKQGMKGTYCLAEIYDYSDINQSLVFTFKLDFKGRDQKPAQISESIAFHPDCSHYTDSDGYGGNSYTHGLCKLTGGVRYSIGVGSLIKLRE